MKGEPEAPAMDLSRARVLLDGALVGLRSVKDPGVPLRSVERHLAGSLRALYQALAAAAEAGVGAEAFDRHARATHTESGAALAALEATGSQDPAAGWVARDVAAVVDGWERARHLTIRQSLRLPRPGPSHVPRAQQDVPVLVEVTREPLAPAIVLPVEDAPPLEEPEKPAEAPPEPGPATIQDLEALLAQAKADLEDFEAPAKKKPAPDQKTKPPPAIEEVERTQLGEALPRRDVERARARAFFEDLAMMSLMRQPDEGDLWKELRPVEERLLARVDGILACGTWVLPELVKLLDERPVPDPEMVWGVLLLHGCLAGDDALHQVERVLRTAWPDEPEVFDAACDALAFVPHPDLEGLLQSWLRGEEVLLRRLAVRVMGRRGWLEAKDALALARGDAGELALEAARALPSTRGELDLGETAWLLRHEQEAVVGAAIETLLLRRSEAGILHARALLLECRGSFAGAALWAAIGGGPDVQADFEATMKRDASSAALLEALGWYGSLRFADFLIERLRAGQLEAVGALQRLTGASLTDEEPEPEYEKGEEPFVRGFVPPTIEPKLTKDAEVWAAWWKRYQGRAALSKRYRWGHLWSPQDNLWELEDSLASMRERRLAHHELVARTGGTHLFDPRDFVVRQEAVLAQWRQAPELRRAPAGSWALSFTR
ncbi:MAG TPA: hypothetical protein VIG99_00090 [Myxococcaceae bacterium]|jgi:hypothetical protein